jgi:hypothetical protein
LGKLCISGTSKKIVFFGSLAVSRLQATKHALLSGLSQKTEVFRDVLFAKIALNNSTKIRMNNEK